MPAGRAAQVAESRNRCLQVSFRMPYAQAIGTDPTQDLTLIQRTSYHSQGCAIRASRGLDLVR